MKPPHRHCAGFTLLEVALGATILAVGFVGLIEGMTYASEMLDTARKQTLAAQVMQADVEYLRMQPWSTISGLPTGTTGPYVLTDNSHFPEFSSTSLATMAGTTVKFARTVASSNPHTNLRQITMTVTWTSITGKSHSRSCSAYIGKYGLSVSYQKL
jgi:Tfp pilus assembly protein PilV